MMRKKGKGGNSPAFWETMIEGGEREKHFIGDKAGNQDQKQLRKGRKSFKKKTGN